MLTEKKDPRRQSGWTAVEIALVMLGVGLITGGVLQAREMILTAKIHKTIEQVNSIQVAATAFKSMYNQLPGDFTRATRQLPGCTAPNCFNGNGDKFIGLWGTGIENLGQYEGDMSPSNAVETSMFWKHLALADLIKGVEPTADPRAPRFGQTNPTTPLGGGFWALYSPDGVQEPNLATPGNYIGMMATFDIVDKNNTLAKRQATSLVPSSVAFRIDTKIDDGQASTGTVGAEHEDTGCKIGDAFHNSPPYPYINLKDNQPRCKVYFLIK